MTQLDGAPILTAAAMAATERRAIEGGSSVEALMARAGAGVAAWAMRMAGRREVLVLCGPGNNGGDGYVAAARLHEAGVPVRVAAIAAPTTDAAKQAKTQWYGVIDDVMTSSPAPIVIDALFGTGLSRPLDPVLVGGLKRLVEASSFSIAVDLPSGIAADDGGVLAARDQFPTFDLTLALGALKPAHLLQPAARFCGTVRVVDIGLEPTSDTRVIGRPRLVMPGPDTQKYSRGHVTIIGGPMPGAAALAAQAALRAGAGYALLLADGDIDQLPHAVVCRQWAGPSDLELVRKTAAILVGPGLGRDQAAREKLAAAIASDQALVVDGDALRLLDLTHFEAFARRYAPVILTPHGGEFGGLFGAWSGSKLDAARAAARTAHATVVFKGADTVIAHRDGKASIGMPGDPWLSTAGTGDVLAGTIGAMLATGMEQAAEAGVWLHGDAARRLRGPFLADDLAQAIGDAVGGLRTT